MEKLKKQGKCPSCEGSVVGVDGSSYGHCVKCGAKVEQNRAEPSDAIKTAVREVLSEYDLKPKEKKGEQNASEQESDAILD